MWIFLDMKGKKIYLIEEEYGYSLYMKKYNQNLINKYYCKGFGDFWNPSTWGEDS